MKKESRTEIISAWNQLLEEEFDAYRSLDQEQIEDLRAGKEVAVNQYPGIARYLQAIKAWMDRVPRDNDK